MKQIKRYLWGILSMMFVCWVFLNTHMIHEVQASGYDTTAPKLNGVTLDKAEIILPGVVNVTLDITEEETGVESVFIQLNYVKENGEWVNNVCRMVQYTSGVDGGALFTGKHTFSIAMPSKIPAGTYVVYVSLNDGQQNRAEYCGVEEPHGDEQGNIVSVGRPLILQNVNGKEDDRCPLNTFLTAKSEFDVAFQNGIENPKLYDNLKQMNNNATAMVNYTTSSHIAPEQFFEAIKQTGKTLVFSDNEVQWVFRGNDIINPLKAVDLSVKIREVDGSVYGNDNRVLQLDFAENGLLPGKARIRLKSDYIYTLFSLKEPVRLYYIDKTATLQDANVKLIVDGTDSWCEFYVTHNSRYVLSSGKVTLQNAENPNKKVKVKKVKITGEKSAPAGSKIRLQVKVTPKNATNKDVKWKSSNTKVATVNAKGVVTLKKNSGGKTVTITATAKDGSGKKDTIKIKSEKKRAKVKSIKISGKTKMKAGKTQKLKATVKVQGNAPKKVKWSVDNKKYATVSANGTVKAKKEGKGKTIRVTAKAMDGSNVKATFRIKIK